MVLLDLFDARPFKLALAVLSRELFLSLKAEFQVLIRAYSSLVIQSFWLRKTWMVLVTVTE